MQFTLLQPNSQVRVVDAVFLDLPVDKCFRVRRADAVPILGQGSFLSVLCELHPVVGPCQKGGEGDQHDNKQDNPDGAGGWLLGGDDGHEGVHASRKHLITDVSVELGVSADPEADLLSGIIDLGVVIGKHTEEFLEEHTSKNHVLRLLSIRVQVGHIQVAKRISATNENLLSESSHGDSHVVAIIGVCEVKFEGEVIVSSEVSAGAGQHANTVQCIVTSHIDAVDAVDVAKQSQEVRVNGCRQAKTFEVGRKSDGVALRQVVEEFTRVSVVLLVHDTVAQAIQWVRVIKAS